MPVVNVGGKTPAPELVRGVAQPRTITPIGVVPPPQQARPPTQSSSMPPIQRPPTLSSSMAPLQRASTPPVTSQIPSGVPGMYRGGFMPIVSKYAITAAIEPYKLYRSRP